MSAVELPTLGATVTWQSMAACHGRTTLMYAEDQISERIAVAVCQGCPVRPQCLADVISTEPPLARFGVRAGLTVAERQGW